MTDAERLDWLEEMGNRPGGILLHSEHTTGRLGLGLACTGRSLREAIDQANFVPETEAK